jgi:hypothetical protein
VGTGEKKTRSGWQARPPAAARQQRIRSEMTIVSARSDAEAFRRGVPGINVDAVRRREPWDARSARSETWQIGPTSIQISSYW